MKNKISERVKLVDVALGNTPPDAVIRGGNLVNVNTREIHKADVVIMGRRIAAVVLGESDYAKHATTVIDADGQYLVPGFIDSHIHLESSSVTVTELAREIVPRGVTAVVEDPHEIANVLGVRGIELFLEESKNVPLNFFLRVPGKVPAMPDDAETAGGDISLEETKALLNREEAAQLAGDINPSVILGKDLVHFEKIDHTISLKKTVGGQSPGLKGGALNAFIAAGPEDSHVSFNLEEVLDILRHGLTAILTPKPFLFGPEHYAELAEVIRRDNIDTRRILLCTDDRPADHLHYEGGLDAIVRLAISKGIEPIMAIQMATINVAQHLRMSRDFGSITPGRMADIVILDDLEAVRADKVLVHGKLVAEKGELVEQPPRFTYPRWAKETIHIHRKVTADDLAVRINNGSSEARARVLIAGVPKKLVVETLRVSDGVVLPDEGRDIFTGVAVVSEQPSSWGQVSKTAHWLAR
jgi:adenine deaminase